MTPEIQGAIVSLKSAAEIVRVLYTAKLDTDTKEKIDQLKDLVFNARESALNSQNQLTEVLETCTELKRKMAELIEWGEDKKRYQLFKTNSIQSVVYAIKESAANGEPPHYLCTNCYEDRRKSILNNKQTPDKWTIFDCPKCNSSVPTGSRGEVSPIYIPD